MEDRLLALLTDQHHGVVVTLKRDGRPQLSNVSYTFDPETRVIRASLTAAARRRRTSAATRGPAST